MGVVVSYFNPNGNRKDDPDPVTGLTSQDKTLIKTSWAKLRADTTASGVKIFLTLFQHEPGYQKLFPFRDVPKDQLKQNKRFLAHCNSFMYGFSSLVDNVGDADILIELLKKQGEAHKPRGVEARAYDVVENVLIEILEKDFDQQTVEAWKKGLKVMLKVIVEGANY